MRIGVSLTSHHSGDPGAALRALLDRVRAAAAAGLDHLTFGDHHAVGPDGNYLQGVPVLARALAEWPADRSVGLLFLVPLWHPVLMAEHIGTLAAMTDQPLIVQTGIGHGAAQFGAMGASEHTRGRETDRRVALVKELLSGRSVTDPELGIADAAIGPTPSRPVEWWIGSGRAPAALQRAAVDGDALYLSPGWTVDQVADLTADYRQRCATLGRPARVVLRRDVVLHDDHGEASAMADAAIAAGYRGMSREALLAGSPASTAETLAALRDAGADEITARVISVPQSAALRTLDLLGEAQALVAS